MLANSDVHAPISFNVDFAGGQHRPTTLVFAKGRTAEAIKDALFNRRTAVYQGPMLIGEEQYVRPIYEASLVMKNPNLVIKGNNEVFLQVHNRSDIDFELVAKNNVDEISIPKSVTLYAHRTVLLRLRGADSNLKGMKILKLPYMVKNILITPEQGLPVILTVNVEFVN